VSEIEVECVADPPRRETLDEKAERLLREAAAEHGDCPFCRIIAGRAPVALVREWPDALAFVPLRPVVEGHTLVVPKEHVPDFAADPEVSAAAMRRAAELMRWTPRPMNLITSKGREATQSVWHLHLHLVPRAENDGLALPWYSGKHKRHTAPAAGR
jgi:histidine triad (HIT) family protein